MKIWNYKLTEATNSRREYHIQDNTIFVWGYLSLMTMDGYYDDAEYVIKEVLKDEFDYNQLHGFFKILIDKKNGSEIMLLTDNSGSQMFYIDEQAKTISDSLLLLTNERADNRPNFEACSRFLRESRVFSEKTVVEGIISTEKDFAYILKNGGVYKRDKQLVPFDKSLYRVTLKDYMDAFLSRIDSEEARTVLTGGTDNRAIIAHMLRIKKVTRFILSGRKSNPDVTVAKNISEKLNTKLDVYDPDEKAESWIRDGFYFSDGIYDAILSYRHYRLMQLALNDDKVKYIIGGVGGEFYKNDFCRFIRRGYFYRKVDAKRLARDIFSTDLKPPEWFSYELCEGMRRETDYIYKNIKKMVRGSLLCKCNSVGFWKLTKSMSTVTNNYARFCTKIDPLMDRGIVVGVSNDNALRHCMYYWQRSEISKCSKLLSRVKTDRNLTCSTNVRYLVVDWVKVMLRYLRYAANKLFKGMSFEFDYWNQDYLDASDTYEYKQAVETCYRIGLLAQNDPNGIPLKARGRIITLGMLFSQE